jgi:hypothetical protein
MRDLRVILYFGERRTSTGYIDVVVVGGAYKVSVSVCCATDSNEHCTQPPSLVAFRVSDRKGCMIRMSADGRGGGVYGTPTVVHDSQYWCHLDFVFSLM